MTEFPEKAVLTRYDLTLWFLRAILLVQSVSFLLGLVNSALSMILAPLIGRNVWPFGAFAALSSQGPDIISIITIWLLAPALVAMAVGDKFNSGPPTWKNLWLPCVGLALIARSLGPLVVQSAAFAWRIVETGAFSSSPPSPGAFDLTGYMWVNFASLGLQFLAGIALAFVPVLVGRFRNSSS